MAEEMTPPRLHQPPHHVHSTQKKHPRLLPTDSTSPPASAAPSLPASAATPPHLADLAGPALLRRCHLASPHWSPDLASATASPASYHLTSRVGRPCPIGLASRPHLNGLASPAQPHRRRQPPTSPAPPCRDPNKPRLAVAGTSPHTRWLHFFYYN